jgi:UDP-3-O-[3-hydroxymyristoyl] glucosamine N-acyltransferase
MKLSEIAQSLGVQIENVSGDLDIAGVAGIEEAGASQITFIANPKYASAAKRTKAAAIIVSPDFPAEGRPVIRSKNPYLTFAKAIELFYEAPKYGPSVHPTAVIHPSAKIGRDPHIAAYVVVDADVVIGDGAVLNPHVVIYRGAKIGRNFFAHAHAVVREFCEIGDNVVLQNGVIIGADGFGFARDESGWRKILQSGKVVLGDNVEVQANSTVDRSSIGETRVGDGTKIDNLVMIGHGCTVGEHTMLCSQVGLAGSTEVGDNVILAGKVGVAGHLKIGDGAVATALSGIPGDVAAGATVSGYPAIDNKQWLRSVAVFNKLPELAKLVRKLARTAGEKAE